MEKRKEVSIWAPLRYANYGDDMQAIAFALLIKKLGYDVKVFQLEESLAESYQIVSCASIDELCSGVNLCIIAGGALLTPFRWYKRILSKSAREYEMDFKDLFQATLKYPNVKFCAISFGGDGQVRNPATWFSKWRIRFFESPAFLNGTVRLAGDVEQMKFFDKNVTYYPDMLFQAPMYFPPLKLKATVKYRVGFNLKKGKYLDKKFLADLFDYAEAHDDMEFHFTTTHMQKIGLDYQYTPARESKNIYIDRYESPIQLLGVLASMDCFVTSMLHVGLTGLTTGTPFLSYRGPGKTKSFLRSIGGDWAIVPDNISFEKLRTTFWNKTRNMLYQQYDIHIIEEMRKDSLQQYEFCKRIVSQFA